MHKKTWPAFLMFLSVASALSVLGFYVLNINKGYNLLDEGFYLLSASHPVDSKQQLSSFHQYLHLLMVVNSNIVFLRFFNLFFNLFALSFLAYTAFKFLLKEEGQAQKGLFFLLLSAMITVYGLTFIFPNIPNYNSFTISGTLIFCSLAVLLVQAKQLQHKPIYAFFLGFVAIFVFCNKFTTGILLLFLALIVVCFMRLNHKKLARHCLVFLLLGILSHFLLFFLMVPDLGQFFKAYQAGFQSTKIMHSDHSLALLIRYFEQIQEIVALSYQKYHWVFYAALGLIAGRYYARPFRTQSLARFFFKENVQTFLDFGLVLWFFALSYHIDKAWGLTRFLELTSFYFSAMVLMALLLLSRLKLTQGFYFKEPSSLFLLSLLLFLPLMIALGTNNPLALQMLLSCFVWMPIVFFLAYQHSKIIGLSFIYVTMAGIGLLSTYFALYNMQELPYGLFGNLAAQKHRTKVNNTHLYLDKTSKYIIDNTGKQLKKCGFKPQDYLLSLSDVPGLTYAVKARSPACPWYFGQYPGSDQLTSFCLHLSKIEPQYILFNSLQGQNAKFSADNFDVYLPGFSKKYELCGEVNHIAAKGGVCCKVRMERIQIYKKSA